MRIFVLTANYELRVSRKSHLRDPYSRANASRYFFKVQYFFHGAVLLAIL